MIPSTYGGKSELMNTSFYLSAYFYAHPQPMSFKDNWLKTDELCPHCGQVTKRVRGITKQNIKRLFTMRFTLDEAIYSFVILMVIVIGFLYMSETQACRQAFHDLATNPVETCRLLMQNYTARLNVSDIRLNLTLP